jgi:hypothetical protein
MSPASQARSYASPFRARGCFIPLGENISSIKISNNNVILALQLHHDKPGCYNSLEKP